MLHFLYQGRAADRHILYFFSWKEGQTDMSLLVVTYATLAQNPRFQAKTHVCTPLLHTVTLLV